MPVRRTTRAGYERAHQLRKALTPAEAKLWAYLRASKFRGVNFRRQHAIGQYVVDFCSPRHNLILEVDGSPHLESRESDAARTAFLVSQGYRVLRFWNNQVMNDIQGVARTILDALALQ